MKTTLVTMLPIAATFVIVAMSARSVIAAESEPTTCVELTRIDHTRVVDDQNILFYMRNGDIYSNHLSHPAPEIDRNRPFMYATSIGRICKGDIITVLENWGFGFTQGASTTLGRFEPIDEARASSLTGK
jgi:hypothetical protein